MQVEADKIINFPGICICQNNALTYTAGHDVGRLINCFTGKIAWFVLLKSVFRRLWQATVL